MVRKMGSPLSIVTGGLLIAFCWAYPHFVYVLLAGAMLLHGIAARAWVCRFRDSSVPPPDTRGTPSITAGRPTS